MPSFNQVTIAGHLTRDPELKYTPSGKAVCQFGLAINEKYKTNNETREKTCFVEVSTWGKQAETCNQYMIKGSPILVAGKLDFQSWEGQDGQKRTKLSVVARNITFLPNNKSNNKQTKQTNNSKDEPPFPSDDEIPF